jgi:hypothetical protein
MQKFKAWGLDAYTDNPELAEEFSSTNLCVISISGICLFVILYTLMVLCR